MQKANKKVIEAQFEIMMNCVICAEGCIHKHNSRKEKDQFELCSHCTEALRVLKEEWLKEAIEEGLDKEVETRILIEDQQDQNAIREGREHE